VFVDGFRDDRVGVVVAGLTPGEPGFVPLVSGSSTGIESDERTRAVAPSSNTTCRLMRRITALSGRRKSEMTGYEPSEGDGPVEGKTVAHTKTPIAVAVSATTKASQARRRSRRIPRTASTIATTPRSGNTTAPAANRYVIPFSIARDR
jgi:hypothetical protein